MVESRLTRSVFGIDDDELLRAITKIIAIPKTCILLEPMRCDLPLIHSPLESTEPAPASLRSAIHPVGGGIIFIFRCTQRRRLSHQNCGSEQDCRSYRHSRRQPEIRS